MSMLPSGSVENDQTLVNPVLVLVENDNNVRLLERTLLDGESVAMLPRMEQIEITVKITR